MVVDRAAPHRSLGTGDVPIGGPSSPVWVMSRVALPASVLAGGGDVTVAPARGLAASPRRWHANGTGRPMHTHTIRRNGLLLAVAALVVGGCGDGSTTDDGSDDGSAAPVSTVVAAPAASDTTAPDADSTSTGIEVHGAWRITVRDPDGTIASDTHFHNDLVTDGARTLAALIGSPGTTLDTVTVVPVGSTLCQLSPNPASCQFDGDPQVDGAEAVLTVEATAPADGTIQRVATRTQYEFEGARRSFVLTDRTLDTPVSYVAGQSVTITVRISFS